MVKVTTTELLRVEVEVWVTPQGYFTVNYPPVAAIDHPETSRPGGDQISGSYVMEDALKAAKQHVKAHRRRVAVPFKTAEGYAAIAKGFHGSHRDKILVWIDDPNSQYMGNGRNVQLDTWRLHRGQVLKPDTPVAALDRRSKLTEAKRKIEDLIGKWDEKWGLDLKSAVQDALKELESDTNAE